MTDKPLRVLILDDTPDDAELEIAQLQRSGYTCNWTRAETEEQFLAHLDSYEVDLILSDFSLPTFDGRKALSLFLKRNLEIPFILVSGTIGEEAAIDALKAGATDYVVKGHLWRLGSVVARALAEKQDQRQRKRVEQVLRFTRFSIDHAADAAFWIAADGSFIYVNDAACESLGYTREEMLSMTVHEVDSYFSPDVWPLRWETTRQGGSFTVESKHRSRDGRVFPVEIKSSYLEFEGRGYIFAFARDITERKKAEKEQIERVRIAALRADIGVALNKSDSLRAILQLCTEAVVRHLGIAFARIWTLNEADNVLELQTSAGMYTHINGGHSRVPVGRLKIGRIAQTQEPHLTNDVANDPDISDAAWAREEQMVAFAGMPLVVEGRLVGVIAMFARQQLSDVTLGALSSVTDAIAQCIQRRRAEDALRKAGARYRDLFENANDIIYTYDLQGNFTSVNKLAERLIGYRAEDLIGMNIANIAAPEYFALERQRLESGENSSSDLAPREIEIICKDGRRLPVEISTRLIYEGDRPAGVQAIARDISERRQAEIERRRLEDELIQAQKMESIGGLAGGIAHDFNNLLTSILGNAQLVLKRMRTEDIFYMNLVEIEKGAVRAAGLTRQLLAFGRRQTLDRRIILVNDTITEFTDMLKRIIGEDIEIAFEPAAGLPPIYADAAQIEQVIMNLAVNARDAMPTGGRIRITTSEAVLAESFCRENPWARPGRFACISVRDTGHGMDAETQQRIFEPFFTTKETGKGTGLGLAVVYGIIKQHDGVVEVRSSVSEGTTFNIYLPVVAEGAKVSKAAEAIVPLRGGAETILVAEDEESLRVLVGNVLKRLGYKVLLASDGQDAVRLYESADQISLVILDLVMPRMGGREAAERIRSRGQAVPVIFVTGYSAEAARGDLSTYSGSVLLQKPFSVDDLGRKVREVLDSRAGAGLRAGGNTV